MDENSEHHGMNEDLSPRLRIDLCVRTIPGILTVEDPFHPGTGTRGDAVVAFVVHRDNGLIVSAYAGLPDGAQQPGKARKSAVDWALGNLRFRDGTRAGAPFGEVHMRTNPVNMPVMDEERPGLARLDPVLSAFDTDIFGFGKPPELKAQNAVGFKACNAIALDLKELAHPGGWSDDEPLGPLDAHAVHFVPRAEIPDEEMPPKADVAWLQRELLTLVADYNSSLIARDPGLARFLSLG